MRAHRHRTIPYLATIAAITLVGSIAPPLFAKKGDEEEAADRRIQAATVEIKKLEVEDDRKAATGEIGQAEALRDKARSILGERKEREGLQRTLDELDGTLALASAKIVESDRRAELEAERKKLAAAKKELETTRASVAQLEKEQAKLDAQLGGKK